MIFSIGLLLVIVYLAYRAAPVEKKEHASVHGAGQIGLLAAVALFGVDYFTSYFYATGEMMSALHPYGLQKYAWVAVLVIALANAVFGFLYMYSLGIFNEGGGSYTAAMRYLTPGLSLIVAVVLLQDYIFTIVVSTLSGVDQLLSITNSYGIQWFWRFLIGASLAGVTYWLTIRGRGESARVVFTMLGIFVMMTILLIAGLILARLRGVPAVQYHETILPASLGGAVSHADRFDEGPGGTLWPGSHVQRHSIRDQRRCRPGQVGQAKAAAPGQAVAFLQRQVGHRTAGADFLLVLRRPDHGTAGLLCLSFQRIRRHPGALVGGQPGVDWLRPGAGRCDPVLGLPDPGGGAAGGGLDDRFSGPAGHRLARRSHR
jgi:hypothetical protein